MADGIMLLRGQATLPWLAFLICFLQVSSQGDVRIPAAGPHSVFLRSRRANQFLLEEILPGNLERECYEERCNYEEARECFEHDAKTLSFWKTYHGNRGCNWYRCFNGGKCVESPDGLSCSCPPSHDGPICEHRKVSEVTEGPSVATKIPVVEIIECPTGGPMACHQLCSPSFRTFTCSCMKGFKLHSDRRSCIPEVTFPCGRIPGTSNSTLEVCHQGSCPWQVFLIDSEGVQLCAGALVGPRSVLTAAHCLPQGLESKLQPSDVFVVTGNKKQLLQVQSISIHDRFDRERHDYDLAFLELLEPILYSPEVIHLCLPTKDFSENILMHPGRMGTTPAQSQSLFYMALDECRGSLNVSHPLSNKMFCMKRENGGRWAPARLTSSQGTPDRSGASTQPNAAASENEDQIRRCGKLSPGTPVASVEEGTAFLTGILTSSSEEDCRGDRAGSVFTKLSRHLAWIRANMRAVEDRGTPPATQPPYVH